MEYKPDMTYKDYHFYIIGKDHIIRYRNKEVFKSDDLKEALFRWDEILDQMEECKNEM